MAEIIKQRQRVREESYELTLDPINDDKPAYWFDCDKNGNVNIDELSPSRLAKYNELIHDPEYEAVVTVISNSYTENAVAICECGNEIELYDEYLGACECPYCGEWHNMFGQHVTNPSCWSQGEDW